MTTAKEKLSHALRHVSFSVPSFLHGLGAGACVIALMGVWMSLRTQDTLERLQAGMPSKTAQIERIEPKPVEKAESVAETVPAEEAAPSYALAHAPIQGLYETMPAGQVPVSNLETGMTPFDAYKKPAELVPGRAPVAIIFLEAGLSESLSKGIIEDLPRDVTLAISPYAAAPGPWMDRARTAGHEVWLTLPLQNDTYPDPDPGPYTILSSASIEQNQDRLMRVLASGAGYAGVITLDNHSFTADNTNIVPVVQQIFGRGLGIIDGRPDRPFFARELASAQSYPHGDTVATLGEDLSPAAVKLALSSVENAALSKGRAIVYAYPTPAIITGVAEWAKTLDTRGLQLAPASALVAQ